MSPQVEPSYCSGSELFDKREFQIGQLYWIKDELVSLPKADRVKGKRKFHKSRLVVIIHNNSENINPSCPTVMVAPLSHRIELKRPFDLPVSKEKDQVPKDSLIQLNLSQPVLKVDLGKYQGQISMEKIEELVALQMIMIGYDFSD